MQNLLSDYLTKSKIDFSQEQLNKLTIYCNELLLWNKKINLVKIDTVESFIENHIIDSLLALPYLKDLQKKDFADVGSGAGLPGIPLAIFLEKTNWTLIERSMKRSSFLSYATAITGINDRVTIVSEDLSTITKKYDVVTFRAFRQFEDFIDKLLSLTKNDGYVVAYKGTKKIILDEIKNSKIENYKIVALKNKFINNERNLLFVQVFNNFR